MIIIDTPGIGETEMMDNMLLEFLPHAVAFVFVVNAKNAGGIHEDRVIMSFHMHQMSFRRYIKFNAI